jgi:hypothetical protein
MFIEENEGFSESRTDSAQDSAAPARKMKFPHNIRFRNLTATIYGRSEAYPFYRMVLRVTNNLRRAEPRRVNREARLDRPSRVAGGDLPEFCGPSVFISLPLPLLSLV